MDRYDPVGLAVDDRCVVPGVFFFLRYPPRPTRRDVDCHFGGDDCADPIRTHLVEKDLLWRVSLRLGRRPSPRRLASPERTHGQGTEARAERDRLLAHV